MTKTPIRFADNLSECECCGAPVVSGPLCDECEEAALEWAGIGECRPDECRHAEDEEGWA